MGFAMSGHIVYWEPSLVIPDSSSGLLEREETLTQSTQSRLTTFISFGVASKTIKLTDFSLTFTAHHTIDTSQEVNLFYSILDKIYCIYFLGCCFSD